MVRPWLLAVPFLLVSAASQAQTEVDEPGIAPITTPLAPQATPPATSRPVSSPPPRRRPPAHLEDQWYYAVGNQKAGPFSIEQLRSMVQTGLLPPETLVWRPGFEDWLPLSAVPEFSDLPQVHPPGAPAPKPGERQRIRGLVIGGSITFGVTWGLAVISSIALSAGDCIDCEDVAPVLWIPLAGPLIANAVDSADEDSVTVVMALWTLAQTAGATMLIIGLIGRKTPELQERTSGWHLTPLVGRVNGLGLSTSF